jgi:lipopolysaccharide/colanic/teichoic acid biosynthesis glycosyltransferase
MSFVGPRANIYENEVGEIKVNPERKRRYEVRPGITGLERLISVWSEKKSYFIKTSEFIKVPKFRFKINVQSTFDGDTF